MNAHVTKDVKLSKDVTNVTEDVKLSKQEVLMN